MLHNKQGSKNSGWASKNNLKFALQIPASDIQKFNSCLEREKHKSHKRGFSICYFIRIVCNSIWCPEILAGAHQFSSFKAIIDRKMGRKARMELRSLTSLFVSPTILSSFEVFLGVEYVTIVKDWIL